MKCLHFPPTLYMLRSGNYQIQGKPDINYLQQRKGFPGGASGKQSTCQCRRPSFDPWVGKIPWRRKWLPTPVFLSGEFHGQRSLADYSPWSHKEADTTEWLIFSLSHFFFIIPMTREHYWPLVWIKRGGKIINHWQYNPVQPFNNKLSSFYWQKLSFWELMLTTIMINWLRLHISVLKQNQEFH